MLTIATLLAVILVALLVTRVATIVLTLTGLSRASARFQARSALTGVGFTTSEAEAVVNHPVRRRVIMLLMLIGSAGVVTVIATLMLSFVGAEGREAGLRLVLLVAGLVGLIVLAQSALADRVLSRLIERALARWTELDVRDYDALLRLGGDYRVVELFVKPDHWTAGRRLEELRPWEEGLRVLGVVRDDGTYLGAPVPATEIRTGDTLVVYGRGDALSELAERPAGPAGDEAHRRAAERRAARDPEPVASEPP
jgi:hypothetical protein